MRTALVPIVLALVTSLPSTAAARGLTPVERRLVAAVDRRNDEALALLERVVEVNSGTMNFAGVREIGRLFDGELAALGFSTRWVDGAPFGRAGHLVAERSGAAGPALLLIGHLDTVFEADSPFQHFTRTGPTSARGPGVIDMKGGDVILTQALKALADVGALGTMNVRVVLSGDEEDPGAPLSLARRDLVAAARRSDVALGFEDGDGDPRTAVIARRGSTGWTLTAAGTTAHSSQIFTGEVGAGAVYEVARILDGFYRELRGEPYLTFNPGVVLGGTRVDFAAEKAAGTAFGKDNVVAAHALVAGDLRTLSPEQLARAKAKMQEIVAAHLPGTAAELNFDDSYPPMAPSVGNRRLLALLDEVSRDLGLGAVVATDPGAAGAADVSFAAPHVAMAIDGLGLMGHDDHSENETADLATLPTQTRRAALLLYRLSRGAAAETGSGAGE